LKWGLKKRRSWREKSTKQEQKRNLSIPIMCMSTAVRIKAPKQGMDEEWNECKELDIDR